MRRYSDPVQVRSAPVDEPVDDPVDEPVGAGAGAGTRGVVRAGEGVAGGADGGADGGGLDVVPVPSPQAFIWQGRLYVVRRVLDHWRERRSWWRDALDPVPGRPTGIDVASREQHVWRVEASRGLAHGTGVFDLSSDGAPGAEADWRLVGVSD